MGTLLFIVLVVIVVAFIASAGSSGTPSKPGGNEANVPKWLQPRKTPKQLADEKIICPHCQTAGHVTTKDTKKKRGVSGGKATAAVLTGGFSMLATGLSRKEHYTQMTCANCRTQWLV